jgi:SAM-dependent methyltransferase
MERINRKPFQGITNIIWFNWHYYVIASVLITVLLIANSFLPVSIQLLTTILLSLTALSIIVSLTVSWYIYDHSDLYALNWLNSLSIGSNKQLVNINAGFDETSLLLKEKYPDCDLIVFDFYDPAKHTEISIERARKAYPPFPGTTVISTNNIPLKTNSADYIFLTLAAHEIRNDEERINFFKQLEKVLSPAGKIIVVEHQRDIYNFMAYNFGFFHFFSTKTWKQIFSKTNLSEESIFKITPFISAFVLTKNGTTS